MFTDGVVQVAAQRGVAKRLDGTGMNENAQLAREIVWREKRFIYITT